MKQNNGKKRGRGRPKKKPPEKPSFKTDDEMREYLMDCSLELSLHLKEQAIKKNNIKSPEIARAKAKQYQLALQSIEVTSKLLNDKQSIDLQRKVNMLEMAFKVAKENNSFENVELFDVDCVRNGIKPKDRITVFERDNYTCQLCGRTVDDGITLEVDHKLPVAHGGGNDLSNLQTLCHECNIGKGARLDLTCVQETLS